MKNTLWLALILATTIACGAATPQQTKAGVDVCAATLATLPFVQKEAKKIGMQPIEFAKVGCESGLLVGQTVEDLIRDMHSREICPVTSVAGATNQ